MPWSSTSTSANNIVRLLVADTATSTASELLPDAAYTRFNTLASSIWGAAALAANTLAARAASSDSAGVKSKAVGDLKIEYSAGLQDAETYKALAHRFSKMAAAGITPSAGGIFDSEKQAMESDTDRLRPAFVRRLFDNPQAQDVMVGSTST